MTRILVIEPTATGHRMQYVRHIVAGAEQAGCKVILATSESARGTEPFKVALGPYLEGLEIHTLGRAKKLRMLGPLGSQLSSLLRFREAATAVTPDIVFVPYGNYIDKAAALVRAPFGGLEWSILTMRETFHHRAMGVIRPKSSSSGISELLYTRLLGRKRLRRAFTIDELIKPYVERKSPELASKITFCDEPVPPPPSISRKEARAMLDIPANKKVLLVYGQMNERKGLDHAIACMASLPEDCALLVVGTQNAWAASLLGGEAARQLGGSRIFAVNRYVDEALESACFAASDAVWMGYRAHYGSSGVLTQAAVAGLPVLACQEGLIGYRTKAQGLGQAVDVTNHEACVHALSDCLQMGKDELATMKEKAKRLTDIHTPESFAKTILSGLGEF